MQIIGLPLGRWAGREHHKGKRQHYSPARASILSRGHHLLDVTTDWLVQVPRPLRRPPGNPSGTFGARPKPGSGRVVTGRLESGVGARPVP